jgi:bacterioferritin (cytochrome b1)
VLTLMGRLKRESKMRNKYNHCIYSFDENGDISSTQLMRLVEDDKEVHYGKVEQLDTREIDRLEKSIREIVDISKALWVFIRASPRYTDAL